MAYINYGSFGNYGCYGSCPGHPTPSVMGSRSFEEHLRDRHMHERYSLQPPHRGPRPIYPQPLIDHRQRPLDQPRLQNPHQRPSTAHTTSLNQLDYGSLAYQVPSNGFDHHMHAGMGCGSVTDPQSRFGIDQRLGDQLAAGICRLRTGPTSPPAVRDLHFVDDSGVCPICKVTYTFGSVDACPEDERRVPPMTDKHAEHEAVETAADVPNDDGPDGRTTGEERKSRLQAVNETKACEEVGESTTKDTNHDDPKIILAHADTQPNATCAEKAAGSDSDDGLQPPVRDIQSSSTHVRYPLENGHSSGVTLQVSKDSIAHDGITYADYIHHVKVTERMLKAQLAAVTNMSFAEYARQVNEVQPTTAMNLPLEPKPIAYTDSCDTSTASTSDIMPVTHAKQKTIPVLSPGRPKSNNVGGTTAAYYSKSPRAIIYPDHISATESSTTKSQKPGASKSYAKAPAKQLTTSFDKHLSQPGIILTPTSSEPNSDQGRRAAPKPVGGQAQDSGMEVIQDSNKKAFYDSDIEFPQNNDEQAFYDSDIESTQARDAQAYNDSDAVKSGLRAKDD